MCYGSAVSGDISFPDRDAHPLPSILAWNTFLLQLNLLFGLSGLEVQLWVLEEMMVQAPDVQNYFPNTRDFC